MLALQCAHYKQLKPEPELSNVEQGYIELKKGKENFELKKDKKYFIAFPSPPDNNFYLVLDVTNKNQINSFLTDTLIRNKEYGEKINDQTDQQQQLSVYPVDRREDSYYWLIDNIKEDVTLVLNYRYVPQWRFRFENKYTEFQKTLEESRIDRSAYESLGTTFHFKKGFNYTEIIGRISNKVKALDAVLQELLSIESIFPATIVNSQDEAYLNYKSMKSQLEDELSFQTRYLTVLAFFNKINDSEANIGLFIDYMGDFVHYFSQKDTLDNNVVEESKKVISTRFDAVVSYYKKLLSIKDNAQPLDEKLFHLQGFHKIKTLHQVADLSPSKELVLLVKFITLYDETSTSIMAIEKKVASVTQTVTQLAQMPSSTFFRDRAAEIQTIYHSLPQKIDASYKTYLSYPCTNQLNQKIQNLHTTVTALGKNYQTAQRIVVQLNALKENKEYRSMLSILLQHRNLDFLLQKYKELDKLSMSQQAHAIREALENQQWVQSETALTSLHQDNTYLYLTQVLPFKHEIVSELEDSLYTMVDRVSRAQVHRFIQEHISTVDHVDSLYTSTVFVPVYDIMFSSGSKADLTKRKNELAAHLEKMKENEFPKSAIKHLYEQFIKNPDADGVLKARAIVAHGQHYKGNDKRTKLRIAECNPWSSKWITKAKQYRRVFAFPITDNQKGSNRYFMRLNIRVPTDAKFPVYDVNIKLPKYVAQKAAIEQWYESITLNKQALKNEGRFSITAPTVDNDYECQITPVRMIKDQNNFLDIYFKHNSFRAIPISVMVQKPIIKKN